jgi:plastocyanin
MGLAAAAALGAAVAIVPTVATSETPVTIEAENVGVYEHHWKPSAETVSEGAVVPISNPTEVAHGVRWYSGPETPKCSEGVPVGEGAEHAGTKWSGTCTFVRSGTYTFWCSVHGKSMSATVTVTGTGTTTATTTGTTGTTPEGGGTMSYPTGSAPPEKLKLASRSVHVRSSERGRAVRGSVSIPSAAVGGRLEVRILARRASLAGARPRLLRVGRFVRSAVGAGTVPFTVPLSASGRRALARAGRLALILEVRLTAKSGAAARATRKLTLRRP